MNEPPTMSGRLALVIAAGLALTSCCKNGNGCYIPHPTGPMARRAGLGPVPERHHAIPAKVRKTISAVAPEVDSPNEEDLAKLRPYSKEWGAALDAMNRAADAKLKTKLIICRDCMPPESDDRTGSIAIK